MNLLRSILFALIFYPVTLVIVLRALFATGGNPLNVRHYSRMWARWNRWCCRHLLAIEVRVEGEAPQGAVIFASKHQSMFETVDLIIVLHDPAIVLKRELADLPLWGRVATACGAIPVDREGSATALRRMLRAARAAISADRGILIFPEGTRVAPGEQPPLRAGFAGLYSQLKLPVVPVALDSGRLWGRRRFVKKAGVVTVRFGETIPPGLPRDEVEARVHKAINALD